MIGDAALPVEEESVQPAVSTGSLAFAEKPRESGSELCLDC